eukprot:Amastigsp_a177718_32.p2 type:complete len:336 gc:universal Amastigsp_a177718_32:3-1010(+)
MRAVDTNHRLAAARRDRVAADIVVHKEPFALMRTHAVRHLRRDLRACSSGAVRVKHRAPRPVDNTGHRSLGGRNGLRLLFLQNHALVKVVGLVHAVRVLGRLGKHSLDERVVVALELCVCLHETHIRELNRSQLLVHDLLCRCHVCDLLAERANFCAELLALTHSVGGTRFGVGSSTLCVLGLGLSVQQCFEMIAFLLVEDAELVVAVGKLLLELFDTEQSARIDRRAASAFHHIHLRSQRVALALHARKLFRNRLISVSKSFRLHREGAALVNQFSPSNFLALFPRQQPLLHQNLPVTIRRACARNTASAARPSRHCNRSRRSEGGNQRRHRRR